MDLNKVISHSLRIGVVASAVLSTVGILIWSLSGFSTIVYSGYSSLNAIVVSALQGEVVGLVYLGVIVLIATPIVRVIISAVYFGLEKDRPFVAITLAVLAMMFFAIYLIPR